MRWETPSWKTVRAIFFLLLNKKCFAGLCFDWYIGDQYDCDIVGARNAGLFPVWYTGAIDMSYTTVYSSISKLLLQRCVNSCE